MPLLMLVVVSLVLAAGFGSVMLILRKTAPGAVMRKAVPEEPAGMEFQFSCPPTSRPACWLAVKKRSLEAVQAALGLGHPKPCSWVEAMMSGEKLFIAPPLKGWVLVFGSGLPDPVDDVDACFRFIVALSRKLGHVQFFSSSPLFHHHAWVRAERGRVQRAYVWAGKTLWKQGSVTPAERSLNLRCYEYLEECSALSDADIAAANAEKVPLLAASWSLDPTRIEETVLEQKRGIAGVPSRVY